MQQKPWASFSGLFGLFERFRQSITPETAPIQGCNLAANKPSKGEAPPCKEGIYDQMTIEALCRSQNRDEDHCR